MLAGLEYEDRNIGTYRSYLSDDLTKPLNILIESDSTTEKSAYLQLDYSVDKWRFLGGSRWTDNEKAGIKTTPRASILYSFTDEHSLKLLYSVGFTSPNFVQTSIDLPGLIEGNPSLVAETNE